MKPKHSWNWNGGRTVSEHGYVLLYVGKDHPLADVRGYAYEHRLVAEEKIGRPLRDGERVHHINEDRQDNRPENLEVVAGIAEHALRHRRPRLFALRKPGEGNPTVQCSCGCGAIFPKYDEGGRPRRFVPGHNVIAQYRKDKKDE